VGFYSNNVCSIKCEAAALPPSRVENNLFAVFFATFEALESQRGEKYSMLALFG
jgi:hypothetical protein